MKLLSAITADDDGSCQLMTATCDEEGFIIQLYSTCRDVDYKAIKIDELYANGPTYASGTLTYGNTPSVNNECQFSDVDGDGIYTMKFSFKQCGTLHASDDATQLVYFNKVQGHEYYTDLIMGVTVDFGLTCTADRVALISSSTADVMGDLNFESLDAQERPAEWAQNILDMRFYSDAALTTIMTDNLIPLGENIYPEVTTNVNDEDLKTRITDCWATPSSDNADATSFTLIDTSCASQNWVTIDDTLNGATESSAFFFQSFRFPNHNSIWLHCQVYICHGDENCLHSCDAGRRRRREISENLLGTDFQINESHTMNDTIAYQENGLPVPTIVSRELFVTSDTLTDDDLVDTRMQKVLNRIGDGLEKMQKHFKATRKAVNFLEKILNGDA